MCNQGNIVTKANWLRAQFDICGNEALFSNVTSLPICHKANLCTRTNYAILAHSITAILTLQMHVNMAVWLNAIMPIWQKLSMSIWQFGCYAVCHFGIKKDSKKLGPFCWVAVGLYYIISNALSQIKINLQALCRLLVSMALLHKNFIAKILMSK